MPLFKFRCEDCNKVFEELVSGENKPDCPQCGSKNIKRHFQGKCYFGMSAKGSSEGSHSGCSCHGTCGTCGGCAH